MKYDTLSPEERRRLRQGRRIAITSTLVAVAVTAAIDIGMWEFGVEKGLVHFRRHHAVVSVVFPLNAAIGAIVAAVAAFRLHPLPARRVPAAAGWLAISLASYFATYATLATVVHLLVPPRR